MSEQTFDERFAVLPDAVKEQLLRAHTVLSEMNQTELGHVSGVVHFARPDLVGPRVVLVEVFDVLLRLVIAVLLEQIGETEISVEDGLSEALAMLRERGDHLG